MANWLHVQVYCVCFCILYTALLLMGWSVWSTIFRPSFTSPFQCYIAGIHQNALKRYPDTFCVEAIKDYRANIVILFADLFMSDGGPKRDVNGALVLLGIDCFLSLYKDTTLCSLASSKHGPFHLDDYMLYIVWLVPESVVCMLHL